MNFNASRRGAAIGGGDSVPAFDDTRDRPLFSRHSSQPVMSWQSGSMYQPSSQVIPSVQQSLGFSQRLEQTGGYQGRSSVVRNSNPAGFNQWVNRDGYQGRVAVAWAGDSFSQRPPPDGNQGRQAGQYMGGFSQGSSSQMPFAAPTGEAFSQRVTKTGGRQGQLNSRGGSQASSQRPTQRASCQGQQRASAGQAFSQQSSEQIGSGSQGQQRASASQAFSQRSSEPQAWSLKRSMSQQDQSASKRGRTGHSQATTLSSNSIGRTGTPASGAMSTGHSQQQFRPGLATQTDWTRYCSQPSVPAASLLQLGEATVQDLWDFMNGRFQAMEAQQAHSLAAITAKLDQLLNHMAAMSFSAAANSTQQSTVFELCNDTNASSQPAPVCAQPQPPLADLTPTPKRKSNLRLRRKTPTIRDALSELLCDAADEENEQAGTTPPAEVAAADAANEESPSLFDFSFRA
ncbi:hypothetical protein BOX15_Mlig023463g4 [Macrostomum lignano]|uniref:Uncharacterized protein n=1 Tax=Macrostomum lignano TaxID=282301 RepID=A0A267ECI5_9PLAT|nr:hypothetical protein BOX15_Mlig023463g1 [Macrostomum lignano]PAA75194.1 hypothetical protein BOX15_Mlig023463g4 [Macrostomum lignano]